VSVLPKMAVAHIVGRECWRIKGESILLRSHSNKNEKLGRESDPPGLAVFQQPARAVMNYNSMWPTLRQSFSEWNDHEAPRLGAALAFYTLLSMAPLVILVIAIVALIFGPSTAQNQMLGEVGSMVGREGANAVKAMLEHAQKPATGTFASLFGVITLVYGASGVFGELRSALNKMWDVKSKDQEGIWGALKQHFFSFGMVFAVGFLLLVSLVISAALATIGKFLGGMLPLPEFVLSAVNVIVSLGGTAILFALIFRYVPETKIGWRPIWIGATVTSLLFTIGKFFIGLYLGKAGVGSAYGAAGSLVVIIVWVYYSAMIFFFGAEFTHVLAASGESPGRKAS
jgi:membrane protein